MTTIQNFADFLLKVVSYAENQDDLVKQMSIRQFLSGAINYKKFVEAVEKYASAHREHNDDMTYLEDYAKFVKDSKLTEDSLTQLKELLTQAITPVKLDKIEGDTVIEVTGNNIVLSKVIEQVEADPGFAKGTVKEVRVVARAIVHADVNLSQNKWHGKNFVVWTDELNVVKENCTWNFSGFDKESTFAAENAGMDENGDGKDGEDGKPGETFLKIFHQFFFPMG